mmetsp:Transcript_36606/g.84934  ORF Transcript_36606/g.84934 Transcript_36606/m.84934 type:complete len:230 (+) Transcript_36606:1242-1931(+)
MPLGAGDAHLGHPGLQQVDQLAVLGMHGRHGAEFERTLEAVHQRLVVAHDGVLVGHEVLEAVHAFLAHQRPHVVADALVPPGHGDVEGVVACCLLGPAAPGAVGVHQRLLRVGDDEVDDARRAPGQRRGGAGEEVVLRHRAHEGQLHVGVRVDAARQQVLAGAVEGGRAGRGLAHGALAQGGDAAVDAEHIGAGLGVGIDDDGAADQQGGTHGAVLASCGCVLPAISPP